MKTHIKEVLGVEVECIDDDAPEAIECDALVDKISDAIDGHNINVIMPALCNMLGIVAIESNSSLEHVLDYASATLIAMYDSQKKPDGETLQ